MKRSVKSLGVKSHKNLGKSYESLNKDKFYSSNQTIFLRTQPKNYDPCKKKQNKKSNFHRHFASQTQLVSSAFNKSMYLPPHLNSSQVFSCFTGECKNWQVKRSSTMKSTKKIDYDSVYNEIEFKYQKLKTKTNNLKRISCASKIKDQIDEDRTRYQFKKPYKLYMEERSESSKQDSQKDSAPNFYCPNQNQ